MDAEISRSQLAAALVRVAAGDRAALRMVYQDTSAKLFGVCLRILNDRSEAEDLLQDVYVTVWRKAHSFDPARQPDHLAGGDHPQSSDRPAEVECRQAPRGAD